MKKYRILINVLLGGICVLGIVCFGLMIKLCNNCYSNYKLSLDMLQSYGGEAWTETIKKHLGLFLQTLFAVIFSALSAIASAVAAVIFNLRVAKQK